MAPILFEFGHITVFSLWFFIAIGFVVGSLLFIELAKRSRLKLDILFENSIGLFVWTLLISRLVFIVLHLDRFVYQFQEGHYFSIFKIWDKGFSFWGAMVAWIIGIWYLSVKGGKKPLRTLDAMMIPLLFGMFFGNIGAFLDGINYGVPTELPWGISFRSPNVKYITAVHPTQLYAALYTLVLGIGLYLLYKRLGKNEMGLTSELALFGFSFFKFIEEFFRGDEVLSIGPVRLPQVLALVGACFAGYLLYQRLSKREGGNLKEKLKSLREEIFSKKEETGESQEMRAATAV